MFGPQLWWKGDQTRGKMGRADVVQLPGNQQLRATVGYFRTPNLGALSIETRRRPAAAQLENRQRQFALRLLSLPQGDKAKEIVGAPTAIGRRLTVALDCAGRAESTMILEEPEILDAVLLQKEENEAKAEAERSTRRHSMSTDGSRLDDGAAGYAVVWKNSQSPVGIKIHTGYNQESYDAA